MVNCHLVHRYVHYWAVRTVLVVTSCEIWLSETRRVDSVHHMAAVLLLDLLGRLEDGRQQALVLHKRTIMVSFANSPCHTRGDDVLKITVERLMFAVVNFKICKVTATVLGCKWAFLHIDTVCSFLFLLFIDVVSPMNRNVVAILVVK